MDNEKLKDFFTASGALAETLYIFFNQCVKVGFTPDQAMDLSKALITTIIPR